MKYVCVCACMHVFVCMCDVGGILEMLELKIVKIENYSSNSIILSKLEREEIVGKR